MLRATLLAVALALAAPAAADAAGEVFTLAGAGPDESSRAEGAPAAVAGLQDPAPVAPLPGGGFLVGTEGTVWRVDPQGALHRVAGQLEDEGYTGDDGPALEAEIHVDHLAALPGGAFLLVDENRQRVRMVAPDGTITTVAGGGTSTADGVPALQAALERPEGVAALPGGGFVVEDGEELIREVGPDGLIRTVAGGGKDEHIHGEPATAADLYATDVAVAADGTLLIADQGNRTIDRVAADGTIHVAARPPKGGDASPLLVAALPDGGFAFAAQVLNDFNGGSVRLYRVDPGGTPRRVAGGGPYAVNAPRGLLRRVDGGPATGLALPSATSLTALPDGGLLFSYSTDRGDPEGDLVTYVAPPAPAVLAVALRRDAARVFAPGRANVVHVALTLPATVTLAAGGHSVTRALPAGTSAVPLPGPLPARETTVTVTAADAAGRGAYDRAQVFPPGWLPEQTAQLVGNSVLSDASVDECRRYAAGRVDCLAGIDAHDRCRALSVRLAHARLTWGAYHACKTHAHPRYTRGPLRLRRRDWHCESDDPFCRPALFGRLREADVIPAE
jgi:hypothetical protein